MVIGDILFKMRNLAIDSASQMNLPTYYSDLYSINTTLDFDIVQYIMKLLVLRYMRHIMSCKKRIIRF